MNAKSKAKLDELNAEIFSVGAEFIRGVREREFLGESLIWSCLLSAASSSQGSRVRTFMSGVYGGTSKALW